MPAAFAARVAGVSRPAIGRDRTGSATELRPQRVVVGDVGLALGVRRGVLEQEVGPAHAVGVEEVERQLLAVARGEPGDLVVEAARAAVGGGGVARAGPRAPWGR